MAELGTHLVTERASLVTLRLPLARPSSIPTSPVRAIALPDNRHEAEEEEALQERSSEPLGLESCAATVRDAVKRS